MDKDLMNIDEEIEELMKQPNTMYKYEKLGMLFVCKNYIEKMYSNTSGTIFEVLKNKVETIGAKSTIDKLLPIICKHLQDLEIIAPTVGNDFTKRIMEM